MQDLNCSRRARFRMPGIAGVVAVMLAGESPLPAASLQYLEPPRQAAGTTVVVDGYALAHTAQLLPLDKQGRVVGAGSVEAQLAHTLFNLESALAAAGSGCEHLVKINFYVDGPKTAAAARAMLNKRFPLPRRPAMSWVTTPLPDPQAGLALDAVAAIPGDGPAAVVRHCGAALAGHATAACTAVLPRGEAVYVVGQEEKGTLPEATVQTLGNMMTTIGRWGLDRSHVVHLKAFLQPMPQAGVVRQEIARFFAGQTPPPLTLVEWRTNLPIKIEMIAWAPPGNSPAVASDTVSYFTPPRGMTPSPAYRRVARVHGGKTVYVSGLYADKPGDGAAQVRDVFAELGQRLSPAGSDLRHLVKVTYYCADDDTSTMVNKLRPELYDPQRLPAASKALVQGVALPDRSLTMDVIAVTSP